MGGIPFFHLRSCKWCDIILSSTFLILKTFLWMSLITQNEEICSWRFFSFELFVRGWFIHLLPYLLTILYLSCSPLLFKNKFVSKSKTSLLFMLNRGSVFNQFKVSKDEITNSNFKTSFPKSDIQLLTFQTSGQKHDFNGKIPVKMSI